MRFSTSLLAGAGLLSAAYAIPVASSGWGEWEGQGNGAGGGYGPGSSQPSSTPAPPPAGPPAPLKSGNPFSFPLSNGFPNLSPGALNATAIQAHGTEPNGGAPTGLAADDLTSVRFIAFNELFEVAFFTDLLFNITNNVAGFTIDDHNTRQLVINAITAIQAQEELHADNANKILVANGQAPIQACQYKFPSASLDDAIAFAKTFTDVTLGTLQDVQLHLANNNDDGVVPVIGSVIGQEGEQNGFFRLFGGLIPSELPFLTRSTREFAFSVLNQAVVVPGTCPNENLIDLPIFLPLTVNTSPIQPKDQTLSFSVPVDKSSPPSGLSLVYINSQNVPIVEKIQNAQVADGVATFDAFFPYSENLLNGLTIAALTSSAGPFTSAEDVAKVTIAGPGLIEIL
ncbi:hypothetical protein PV08_08392 [Exophiala spinifera]|uniref:Sexual development protein n=1 Tax=Exophiala spinifera TaxID=91928 RepID=A0A0D2B3H5_9EURO|nr:uncharacterized protein PV08_08392 [Exophiala spinifera]KIW13205.1 hypothetical protein PV08_08392 [Exophiala spinifera]